MTSSKREPKHHEAIATLVVIIIVAIIVIAIGVGAYYALGAMKTGSTATTSSSSIPTSTFTTSSIPSSTGLQTTSLSSTTTSVAPSTSTCENLSIFSQLPGIGSSGSSFFSGNITRDLLGNYSHMAIRVSTNASASPSSTGASISSVLDTSYTIVSHETINFTNFAIVNYTESSTSGAGLVNQSGTILFDPAGNATLVTAGKIGFSGFLAQQQATVIMAPFGFLFTGGDLLLSSQNSSLVSFSTEARTTATVGSNATLDTQSYRLSLLPATISGCGTGLPEGTSLTILFQIGRFLSTNATVITSFAETYSSPQVGAVSTSYVLLEINR